MSIGDAIADARLAVVEAEAAAAFDVSAGEASATLGSAQAREAYQLAIQILKNKAVNLAPALILLEVAAINEGIAAYLAEEAAALAIEQAVAEKARAASEAVKKKYDAQTQRERLNNQSDLKLESALYSSYLSSAAAVDVSVAVRQTLDAARAAATSVVAVASGKSV